MTNVIVAFPGAKDAVGIRSVLVRSGFHVVAACTSGSSALAAADHLREGIVVCGPRLQDMTFMQLREELPGAFPILLLASDRHTPEVLPDGVFHMPMPMKVHLLLERMHGMEQELLQNRRRPGKARSGADQAVIGQAKAQLMEKNGMTEEAAHRYLQKTSMDSGTNLVETARMILSFMT